MSQGLRYMLIGAVFFSFVGLFVKLLGSIAFIQIVFFRSLVSFVMCVGQLRYERVPIFGQNFGLLWLRGLLGICGLSAYFFTIQNLPLAEAATLQYTNPIFVGLIAPFILKEKWHGREWLGLVICFIGVVLIADPRLTDKTWVVAIGLLGAVCSGFAYNIVRLLGLRGEHPLSIVLYFPLVGTFVSGPLVLYYWTPPTFWQWVMLIAIGVTTQIAQVHLTNGLRLERAARATVVNYAVILLSTVYSILLGDSIGLMAGTGMACILLGIGVVSRRK